MARRPNVTNLELDEDDLRRLLDATESLRGESWISGEERYEIVALAARLQEARIRIRRKLARIEAGTEITVDVRP